VCARPTIRRADTQVGPYNRISNDNYSVAMIWHDDKFIRFDGLKFSCQFQPPTFNHFTRTIWPHSTVDNLAKYTLSILRYNSNEVRAWLGVIEPF
jgi:hypothetical protein